MGEVNGFVSSLHDVWDYVRSQNVDKVLQREAWVSYSSFSEAPPGVVWEHLVDPVKRVAWMEASENTMLNMVDGRIGPGSEYHCAHGEDKLTTFTVLDIRPVDYATFLMVLDETTAVRMTDYVVPSGNGTRIVTHMARALDFKAGEPIGDERIAEAMRPVTSVYQRYLDSLAEMAAETSRKLTTA